MIRIFLDLQSFNNKNKLPLLIASRKERSVNQTEINQLKNTEYQKHWEKNEKQSLKAIFNWTDFLPPVSDYPPPGQQEGLSVPRSH